ncbi:hypothetical protein Y717_16375 [Streptomyces scopuliridis RB72]|uniref:MFS transporter n=1 Tax=Streptomyces scopuliridis RB72 TaxID=1440053 RepID=A0A2T7T7W7_9ACTN|nr:hypothetical protein Y717_16375 [Streptomyces scopuliridis RB72]
MVAMDLIRFAALMSVPAAFALGRLSFAQLLVVAVVVGAADIAFTAASGACLKALVRPEDLLVANGRFESTTWTASVLGPPLGGAAIGLFGPVMTVVANAVSYLLSAAGIGGEEPRPVRTGAPHFRVGDLLDGWRYILDHPALRPLFFNTVLVNGLIMATSPVLAVLMLRDLGTATDRVARTLSAWSVTSKVTIAALTALWGLLAGLTGPRTAIAIAGLLLLATPLLLPRHDNTPHHEPERAQRRT